MEECTESQSISEASMKISDFHTFIGRGHFAAPIQEPRARVVSRELEAIDKAP